MRPVTVGHVVSQYFASMATQGVVGNINAPNDTVEYWVGRYGNYQPFGHAGMDFSCPIGTPIYAMADGVVLYAGWGYDLPGAGPVRKWLFYKDFPGILTVIQHDGWISAYAHQSNNDAVSVGQQVRAGQQIGMSGDTGGVDPHLHVEALVDLNYTTGGGLIYGRTDPSQFFGGLAAMGSITPEDDVLTIEDKEWLGNKLFEVLQDKTVLETQRAAIINDASLRNIQGTILPSLNAHVQNLWDGIQAVPGLVVTPDLSAAFDKLKQEISNLKVTVSLEGK